MTGNDLPASIQQLIRQVVRRTYLWPSEKRDVRAELESHFHDAINEATETGLSPDEAVLRAVKSFGDARLAARLIRRGKKRARPVLWKVCVGIWRTGVFTLLAMAVYVGWIFTGRPTPSIDYVARINEPVEAVPEDQRAWPILRQVILDFTPMPDNLRERWGHLRPGDELWPSAMEWVQANRHFLPDIRRAAHCSVYGFRYDNHEGERFLHEREKRRPRPDGTVSSSPFIEPEDDPETPKLISILLPPLASIREIAKFLTMNAQVHLAAGELDEALNSLDVAHRLGYLMLPCPILIEQLVGVAITNLASEQLRTILYTSQEKLSASDLRTLRSGHLMTTSPDTIRSNLIGEQYMLEDVVQYVFTDDGRGDGHLIPRQLAKVTGSGKGPPWRGAGTATIHAGRKATLAKFHEIWSQTDKLRRLPLYDPERKRVNALENLIRDPVQRYRYRLIALLMPSLDRADQLISEAKMNEAATQTVVALMVYRADHGRFPDRLQSLVPDYIASIPIDVYSGAPLRYTVDQGEIRLYSVWRNLTDDGGQETLTDKPVVSVRKDIVPTQKNPADMVYWPVKPPPAQPSELHPIASTSAPSS